MSSSPKSLYLNVPDDFHLHLRDGPRLVSLAQMPWHFGRAIIMPNLKPPVTTVQMASEYRSRILSAVAAGNPGFEFTPLMTLYLTDKTTPAVIDEAKESEFVHAVKYYPAGATTNSDSGVTDLSKVYPALERMSEVGMPLLVHGEVTDSRVDFFKREAVFVERVAYNLVKRFPKLKIVFEHVTTKRLIEFVENCGPNVAATITPQHLLFNRNALFDKGLKPHFYCLPILKKESDREALCAAIKSGSPKYFAGTDSAPHWMANKECGCASAGCFTAPIAVAMYAQAFDENNCMENLNDFLSTNGSKFYGLEKNQGKGLRLTKKKIKVPQHFGFGDGKVKPLMDEVDWQVEWDFESK
eukprot:g6222.t1